MEEASGLPMIHPALLLKAQFCSNEIDRRHAAEIAQRDAEIAQRDENLAHRSYKMERWVIILIFLERAVGIVGIV
jgi:uncharacterized protein (DUF3084 family)